VTTDNTISMMSYCAKLIAVICHVITGPPTHSVRGQTSNGRGRLSSSSVTLHGRPPGGFSRAGKAMTSCHLQSNYSSTVTLRGGPV